MNKELPNHIQQRNQEVFDTTWNKFQDQKEISPFADLRVAATRDLHNAKRVLRGLGQEVISQVEQLDSDKQTEFLVCYATERQRRLREERRANGHLGWAVKNGLIARNSNGIFNVDEVSKLEPFQENPHLIDIINTRQLSYRQKETRINTPAEIDHHNQHHHEDGPPPITKKWQRWTVFGNAAIGTAELIAGGTSNTLSVVMDGIHNAGDAGTYWLQTENILNQNLKQEKQDKRRKLAHWLISAGSLALSAKAGIEITVDHELTPDALDIFAALSSVGLNSVLYYKLRQGLKRNKRKGLQTPHEKDLLKHFHSVDFPSAGLALFGAGTQAMGIPFVEPAAAVASGLIGAYAFRPTETNLNHTHCAKHNHDTSHKHEHHKEVFRHEGHQTIIKSKKKKLRAALAGITTVAVLGGGLTTVKTMTESTKIPTDKSYTAVLPEQTFKPIRKKKAAIQLTASVKITEGDSQWKIVKTAIENTGHKATIPITNVIVNLAALENKFPNPDIIQAKKKLSVPSDTVIDLVVDTVNTPLSPIATEAEKQFAKDLNVLNQQPDITKQEVIKNEERRLKRITNFLKHHFQIN